MKNQKNVWSRRQFINTTVAGTAGVMAAPYIIPSGSKVAEAEIRIGLIGLGKQAMFLLNGFLQIPGVKVVAGCDVYGIKRKRFEKCMNFYSIKGNEDLKTYEKYQDLLERKDINAVIIATPDHLHAMIAIAACRAGKDVYLEKPLTFTIKEGQELVKAVRQNGRILAVGSQQRGDPNFQYAVNVVQNGLLGKINKVNVYVGNPPRPYDLPKEPLPSDLNWDLWLGPLPDTIHYNSRLDPPISVDPEVNEKVWGQWRHFKGMGGGFTTDWGAHMFDIAQWGLGMDRSGPVEIAPIGDGTEYIFFKYSDGVVMTSEPFDTKMTKGVKFWGEKGWIEVARDVFNASDALLYPKTQLKDPSKGKFYETKIPHYQITMYNDIGYKVAIPFYEDFIESVKTRKDPMVPVEVGHSSCTLCTLGNIACDLKRTITWNPTAQAFTSDKDGAATAKMHYEYRKGWKLV